MTNPWKPLLDDKAVHTAAQAIANAIDFSKDEILVLTEGDTAKANTVCMAALGHVLLTYAHLTIPLDQRPDLKARQAVGEIYLKNAKYYRDMGKNA